MSEGISVILERVRLEQHMVRLQAMIEEARAYERLNAAKANIHEEELRKTEESLSKLIG